MSGCDCYKIGGPWITFDPSCPEHGYEAQQKEQRTEHRIAELESETAMLRTVMVAAAEEIKDHWAAHCDADGYGPVALLHRLEEGIPAEYGYTAGRFAELAAEVEALRADARRLDSGVILMHGRDEFGELTSCLHTGMNLREAIDAAMADAAAAHGEQT